MLKRIFPIISCVALVLCMLAVPASAAGSFQVLNYKDYVYRTEKGDLLGTFERAYFRIPRELSGVQTIDLNGNTYLDSGEFSGIIYCSEQDGSTMSVGGFWPGGTMNKTYLDVSDFQNGAAVSISSQFWFDNSASSDAFSQAAFSVRAHIGVQYYDNDFNYIGANVSENSYYEFDTSLLQVYHSLEFEITKPSDAVYCVFFCIYNFTLTASNNFGDCSVGWSIGNPEFSVERGFGVHPDYGSGDIDNSGLIEELYESDFVDWLMYVGESFLYFEIFPGFPLSGLFYFVLVLGVVLWFIKLIS